MPAEVDKAGAIYDYSNSNYILLGQLIEKVTGTSYAAALRRDLLDGRGLDRSPPARRRPRPTGAAGPATARHLAGAGRFVPSRSLSGLAWSAGGIAG